MARSIAKIALEILLVIVIVAVFVSLVFPWLCKYGVTALCAI